MFGKEIEEFIKQNYKKFVFYEKGVFYDLISLIRTSLHLEDYISDIDVKELHECKFLALYEQDNGTILLDINKIINRLYEMIKDRSFETYSYDRQSFIMLLEIFKVISIIEDIKLIDHSLLKGIYEPIKHSYMALNGNIRLESDPNYNINPFVAQNMFYHNSSLYPHIRKSSISALRYLESIYSQIPDREESTLTDIKVCLVDEMTKEYKINPNSSIRCPLVRFYQMLGIKDYTINDSKVLDPKKRIFLGLPVDLKSFNYEISRILNIDSNSEKSLSLTKSLLK